MLVPERTDVRAVRIWLSFFLFGNFAWGTGAIRPIRKAGKVCETTMLSTLSLRAMWDDEGDCTTYILRMTGRELLMAPAGLLGNRGACSAVVV